MSRSWGRKSWSMSRSTPAAANSATFARASVGRPDDPAPPRAPRTSPRPARRRSSSAEERPLAVRQLGLVPADQRPDHRRPADRRRVPPDRPAGLVEAARAGRRPRAGSRRGHVELVGVAGRDPERARRALAADDDRRARPLDRLRLEDRVLDPVVARPRTTSRRAPPTGRGRSPAAPRACRRARRSAGTANPWRRCSSSFQPAPKPDLDPAAAHLVDGRDDLGQRARAAGT